ncbi:glycosyltransferase [Lentzea albida]|uniref:N-glycosyltransferase n=1 Tax=Lentzea albida TaxID=65499 RepID=A0A1H9WRH7_9PSEU|nr:glycosyltransferase [Lentzea albida]SES36389.1 N-glycosyltransferase [Lentzea albida]
MSLRILFTVANSPSHIRALVPVVRAAEAAGHTVGIATGAGSAADIAAYGVDHLPAGVDILDLVARTLEKTGMTFADLTAMERTVDFFIGPPAEAMATDIIASGWNPDVIVRSTLEFGGVLAAEVLGVPHASVAIGGAVNVVSPPSTLAPLMAPLRASFGLPPDPSGEASFRHLHACLMPKTYDAAEAAVPHSRFYRHENPGRRGDALPPALAELPTDKPWVFASLGTLSAFASDGPSLLRSVVTALARLDCVAVVSTGRDVAHEVFGALPPTVVLVETVPQPLLLECCDLFITHAGHNSVREAMRSGVPLVCTPLFSEQPYNARRCVEAGVGEQLNTGTMTTDDVLAVCRKVLEDPRYRGNARRIRRDMLALPPLEAFVDDLQSLVESGLPNGR